MENPIVLSVRDISKKFGGTQALSKVSLDFRKGEVHALIGENGAGKSTLMNIIYGLYLPDEGSVLLEGKDILRLSIKQRQECGISMVHQEINVFPNLSVARNLFVSREPVGRIGVCNEKKMVEDTTRLINELGIDIRAEAKVNSLSVADRQMIQIMIALSYKAKVIIFDEPNSALTDEETKNLFRVIRDLKQQEIAIIYISHRMEEVLEIADRISVLRDGHLIGTMERLEATTDKMIQMMVGREMKNAYPPKNTATRIAGDVVLKVEGLSARGIFEDVSFELHKGEILGFAGLEGSGRTEVFEAIMGLRECSGQILLEGRPFSPRCAHDAIKQGVIYVPPDRRADSIIPQKSVAQNIALASLERLKRGILVADDKIRGMAESYVKKLKIKAASVNQMVLELSGGNQQKVVFARALGVEPKVLLLNEPTRGIDVGAKYEIYLLLQSLATQGLGILVISSELPELIGISDRIIAVWEGRIAGEFDPEVSSKEAILGAMMGEREEVSA